MLTQVQQKKLNRITEDIEHLLKSDVKAIALLQQTLNNSLGPFMEFKSTGRPPSVQVLENISTNLLAIVLASTKE